MHRVIGIYIKIIGLILLSIISESVLSDERNSIVSFTQAKKVISDSVVPPNFSSAKIVSLPDNWQHDKQGFYGSVWYQINFTHINKEQNQWAVYLPFVNMNAEVWLNDVRLGSGGSMSLPVSRYWHSPMMFVFSPTDLREQNTLSIRVAAYANQFGLLGNVSLGDRDDVAYFYDKQYFNSVTIHVISSVLAGVYALFMFMAWLKRKEQIFLYGALVCLMWSIHSMNLYVNDLPIPELLWEKIMQISVGAIPLFFFFYILKIDGVPYKKTFENTVLIIALFLSLLVLFAPQYYLFTFSHWWQLYAMLFGLLGVLHVLYVGIKYRNKRQLVLFVAFGLVAVCGMHDMLVQNGVLHSDTNYWINYSIPIVLLLLGYLMMSLFLDAVGKAEKLNLELESRVQKAHKKIEDDYEKILKLETEQASNQERERIYRDMHDDMGAKLLSMVYKAESDEMHTLARSAMDDLRSIVSKKPGARHALNEVLLRWQTSSKKRFNEAGIEFNWQQHEILKDILLTSESDQNLQRVLSEAVTNIIKHSLADSVRVKIYYRFNCLRIVICDNGDYSKIDQWSEGRGLSSMKYRAKQLAGKIKWTAKPTQGGKVSLMMPLEEYRG